MPAGTPIIIDHGVYPFAPNPQNQDFGPWIYNDVMYIFVCEEPSVTGTQFLRVYKKAYNAAENVPWEEVDEAGHKETSNYVMGVWFDRVDTIYAIYGHGGVTTLTSFSLASEMWGASLTSFSDVLPIAYLHLRPFSGGWVIYFSKDEGVGYKQAYWRKYAGGSWSTPVRVSDNLSTSTDVAALQITGDDDGRFHLAWRRIGATALTYSRTLDASSGTLGTPKQLTGSYAAVFPGPGVEWGNKVILAFSYQDNSVFPPVVRVAITAGNPPSDPTWVEEIVASDSGATNGVFTVIGDEGDLYVWWVTGPHIAYARKSPGGVWSGAIEWYAWYGKSFYENDGVTLTPWPNSNFFHNGSVAQINGDWEFIVAGYVDDISTVFHVPGHEVAVSGNVYTDEAQDLEVMAE